MMDFNLLIKKSKEYGFENLELYVSTSKSLSINLYQEDVDKLTMSSVEGIFVRAFINNKLVSTYTEKLTNEEIENILYRLIDNSKVIDVSSEASFTKGNLKYEKLKQIPSKLVNYTNDLKIDILKTIYKKLIANKYITDVPYAMYVESEYKTVIKNTLNLDLEHSDSLGYLYFSVVAKENDDIKTHGDYLLINDIKNLDVDSFVDKLLYNAISQLGAKSVKSDKYKVVLSNECSYDLLEVMSDMFSYEKVYKDLSLLKDKEDKQVSSSLITIIDDPLLLGGINSTPFDSEGTPTYKKEVVSNGILKTYLYNVEYATIANKQSTGNGFKSNYKGLVEIKPSNLFIDKGEKSFEEILKLVNDGIYITSLAALHAGINTYTGDFSIQASGYKIESGKKTAPINLITISGNYFDMLNNIKAVGNDLEIGLSGVGSPTIFVGELVVAGK